MRDATRVREEVMQALRAVQEPGTGQPLFAEVLGADDLYHGPWAHAAPDIVLRPASRDVKLGMPSWGENLFFFVQEPGLIRPVTPPLGYHTLDAILAISGERVRRNGSYLDCRLEDVAPTLFSLLDQAPPTFMDGRVLTEHLAETPCVPPEEDRDGVRTAATRLAEETLKERLRALGYL